MDEVAEAGEMILYGLLYHEAEVISFEEGAITLAKTPSWNEATLRKAQEGLRQITGRGWRIQLEDAPGQPSLAAEARRMRVEKLENARTHGVVQALMEAFPGTEIVDVIGEKTDV